MIHQYKLLGYNVVLDVASGSVHAVDEIAYDMIARFETATKDEILEELLNTYKDKEGVDMRSLEECYQQIERLRDAGKLFAPDTFAEKAGTLKNKTRGVVKALCLHIAHTCNLNCSYCFASQGKYHGERAVMSLRSVSAHWIF